MYSIGIGEEIARPVSGTLRELLAGDCAPAESVATSRAHWAVWPPGREVATISPVRESIGREVNARKLIASAMRVTVLFTAGLVILAWIAGLIVLPIVVPGLSSPLRWLLIPPAWLLLGALLSWLIGEVVPDRWWRWLGE